LQFPAAGQSVLLAQAWFVLLHWPPTIMQSLADAQRLPTILQFPMATQSDACMQLAPFLLHMPGCGVQSEFCVQVLLVWIVHLPGSGVQTGGVQLVTGLQVTSGSGLVSQPTGS
jgi:hypothetical protein